MDHNCKPNGFEFAAIAINSFLNGIDNATPVNAFTQTLTGTTNAAKDIVYTVTPQNGNCAGTPFDITVTVTPRLSIPDQNVNICSGGSFNVTPSNSPPTTLLPDGTTYTWQTSLVGYLNVAVYTNIFSAWLNNAAELAATVAGNPAYSATKYLGTSVPNFISYLKEIKI